jgi:hypothetical protein
MYLQHTEHSIMASSGNGITPYSNRQREYQEPTPMWEVSIDADLYCVKTVSQHELSLMNERDTAIMFNKITSVKKYLNNENCSICLDTMYNRSVSHTPCGHTFHTKCLVMQLTYQPTNKAECAECRQTLCEQSHPFIFEVQNMTVSKKKRVYSLV